MTNIQIDINTRVTNILEIEYPIIQAPMNWLTDAKLVSAVSNAGGLGVIGPNSGPIDYKNEKSYVKLRHTIQETQKLTNQPFGVNIIMPREGDVKSEQYVSKLIQVALEENVGIFVAVGEINERIIRFIKSEGAILLYRELTPTIEGSQKLERLGIDILVVTGYDEGGLIPQNRIGTFSILPSIVNVVDIPVIATGGINTLNSVRAAFILGAEGVYLGTRFLVAEEAPTSEKVKSFIVNSNGEDVVQVSELQRSLPNEFVKQMIAENISTEEREVRINDSGGLLTGMREGQPEKGIISVNTAIDLISEISSVESIINELMVDFVSLKANTEITF